MPERDDVAIACFNVIFDDIALGRILYLLLLFLLATYLKGLSVYLEITLTLTDDIRFDAHLVIEECLANIANISTLMPKEIS